MSIVCRWSVRVATLRLSWPTTASLSSSIKSTRELKRNFASCTSPSAKSASKLTSGNTSNLMSIGTRSCRMLNKLTTRKSQPLKSDTPNSLSRTASNWRPNWCNSSKDRLIYSIWGSRSSTQLNRRSTRRLTRSRFRQTRLKTQNAKNTLRRYRRRWMHLKLTWSWSRTRRCRL